MVALLLVGLSSVWAQDAEILPKTNSPYSRLGLGDALDQYFAAQAGMAGIGAAFSDPFHLNTLNPASLARLQATAFEVGLYSRYAALEEDGQSTGVWTGNLNYLALGFPLINPINKVLDRRTAPVGLGMMFALQPKTLVGYNIESTLVNEDGETGTNTNRFKGQGGLYEVNWSTAMRYKELSGGVRLGYLFGKISSNTRVEFDSLSRAWATEFLDEVSYSGLVWSAGLQYRLDFKKTNKEGDRVASGKSLIFGVYGNTANSFNTRSSLFYQRNDLPLAVIDTVAYEDNVRRSGTLPPEFTLGLMYQEANRLRVGLDFSLAQWSQYENEAKPENLRDAWRLAAGLEYIPDFQSYNNYLEKVRYRFGAFAGADPRQIGNSQLQEYGLTLGVGLPIILTRQQTSFINFAVEAGRFGISEFIQETYVQMTLGFTLNDNTWFFKRKFN